MIEVSESVEIDAPVADVFVFMDDPANHVTVTPSLAAAQNVEGLPNGRKRLDYTFRMASVSLSGELEEVERTENEHMLFEMRGQLSGAIELEFEAVDGGTRLKRSDRRPGSHGGPSHTAGCKSVKNFAAPGRRISSRSYSRQYQSTMSAIRRGSPESAGSASTSSRTSWSVTSGYDFRTASSTSDFSRRKSWPS